MVDLKPHIKFITLLVNFMLTIYNAEINQQSEIIKLVDQLLNLNNEKSQTKLQTQLSQDEG